MVKNKRGWVRIIEVFISITLVAGVVLILINNNNPQDNFSESILAMEESILKEIKINESLRAEVLNANLPTNWSDFELNGLKEVRHIINEQKSPILECEARVCSLDNPCVQNLHMNESIYASSSVFSANLDIYSPRQLKLFCWKK
jgi:hypothetical protein